MEHRIMKEVLSFSEIKDRFDTEWVLVEDPIIDDNLNINQAVVLCHSKDRDEVYRKARQIRPKHSAILYTGKLPDDVAVVL
jgi:hypothetical protein